MAWISTRAARRSHARALDARAARIQGSGIRVRSTNHSRANIVIAEPMPGEKDLLQDFLAELKADKHRFTPDSPRLENSGDEEGARDQVDGRQPCRTRQHGLGRDEARRRDGGDAAEHRAGQYAGAIEKGRAEWDET